MLREWQSDRAAAANARYIALVKEASQGRLKVFSEIPLESQTAPRGTRSRSRRSASPVPRPAKTQGCFEAARHRLAPDVPQLAIHVFPLDKVTYPNYRNASSISELSERGCAIENPVTSSGNRAWRLAVGACLADAIKEAQW